MCADSQGQSAVALLKEMHRVMKPSGIYIVVSHAPEENRLTLLRRLNKFSVTGVAAVPKPAMKGYEYEKGVQKNHYVYYCEKN
jgi:ubiquinone/menaquinone biosynthesis C-methylase UbiE